MRAAKRPRPAVPEPPAHLLQTARSIAAAQRPDGAIAWPDGHVDPWDHVECAMALSACGLRGPARLAYQWLRTTQRPDGSWPRSTGGAGGGGDIDGVAGVDGGAGDGARAAGGGGIGGGAGGTGIGGSAGIGGSRGVGGSAGAEGSPGVGGSDSGGIADGAAESHHAAYIAVGVWHEYLVTGDRGFARRMWPAVRAAIGWVLGLQTPRGEVLWERDASGAAGEFALLSGCASILQGLRCASTLGDLVGEPQPDWELAAGRLGHVLAAHPEAFADKSRFSMDWYYPVLGGALRGPAAAARLAAGWETFVVPGLGVRCVSDQPWVTIAETCELVLALDACGQRERAARLLAAIAPQRHDDGSYWTGWQYVNQAHFPAERSSWTAAAVILAADALEGFSTGSGIFRDVPASYTARRPVDPDACGCVSAETSA